MVPVLGVWLLGRPSEHSLLGRNSILMLSLELENRSSKGKKIKFLSQETTQNYLAQAKKNIRKPRSVKHGTRVQNSSCWVASQISMWDMILSWDTSHFPAPIPLALQNPKETAAEALSTPQALPQLSCRVTSECLPKPWQQLLGVSHTITLLL